MNAVTADASEWRYIDLESEDFERLLKELKGYLVNGAKGRSADLSELRETIVYVVSWYDADHYTARLVARINLHEIGEPLARVLGF